ncbi:MAG: hypothetical protein HWQ35_04725 [Nostoc sp. NMS1]|uniref:hypothetical protein n=1 Tax=unclassified Nostoc TaxID=2593658 RepID=UPI0025F3B72A|nr:MULTISPECIES: hypothetical protein [unclassified Nostoc]MBN3905898.1 hypothetical protein [Nostoc sp. NMS1]MBN3989288.1 hypothetical protein [Nostoc sp. NMS2]
MRNQSDRLPEISSKKIARQAMPTSGCDARILALSEAMPKALPLVRVSVSEREEKALRYAIGDAPRL